MKILYYIALAVWYLFSLLPLRVHYVISDLLFWFLFKIVGYRRKVVWKNLTASFPEKSEVELRKIERGFYHFFCDYLVESVKLMTIKEENLRKRMVFKGTELVDKTVESGQSCVVYLGHYCNWEWISSLPLWVTPKAQCGQIYHPIENVAFDQLFLRVRQRMGSLSIPMQDTLRKILEFRKTGQPVIIGYISDQKPHWVNIHHWVNFLHHDTPVLTGTERVARKMNHAVFYLDVRRVRRGYYEAEFKLITRNPQQMREYEITDIYYQMLEATIRRAPEFWLWSHKRWSRTREEFNKRFEVIDGKVIAKKNSQ
ncbi:MAG: lysophospholipid acyltransferase family protein [Prevotella sp.]|nr:lysophospholipid acyltransferase family protein [Prevotella sp.]MBR6493939.1 lysophospholipid acyltransferase family protein [Prevotella sp.]